MSEQENVEEVPQPAENEDIRERHRLGGSEREVEHVTTTTETVELPDDQEVYDEQKAELEKENEARQERLGRTPADSGPVDAHQEDAPEPEAS
jgi:hypothetical protein